PAGSSRVAVFRAAGVATTVSKETPSLPLGDDDPSHLLSGAHHPVIEDSKKDKHPGITIELERIGALYDQLPSMLADAKLSKSLDDLLALEKQLGKMGSL